MNIFVMLLSVYWAIIAALAAYLQSDSRWWTFIAAGIAWIALGIGALMQMAPISATTPSAGIVSGTILGGVPLLIGAIVSLALRSFLRLSKTVALAGVAGAVSIAGLKLLL